MCFSNLDPRKIHGCDGVPPILLRHRESVLAPYLINFSVCVYLHSLFLLAGLFSRIHSVPKKCDSTKPSNNWPMAIIFCLFKASDHINGEISKFLSAHNLPFDSSVLIRPHCTRLSVSSHLYYFIHLTNVRVIYLHSFIHLIGKVRNSSWLFFILPTTWVSRSTMPRPDRSWSTLLELFMYVFAHLD